MLNQFQFPRKIRRISVNSFEKMKLLLSRPRISSPRRCLRAGEKINMASPLKNIIISWYLVISSRRPLWESFQRAFSSCDARFFLGPGLLHFPSSVSRSFNLQRRKKSVRGSSPNPRKDERKKNNEEGRASLTRDAAPGADRLSVEIFITAERSYCRFEPMGLCSIVGTELFAFLSHLPGNARSTQFPTRKRVSLRRAGFYRRDSWTSRRMLYPWSVWVFFHLSPLTGTDRRSWTSVAAFFVYRTWIMFSFVRRGDAIMRSVLASIAKEICTSIIVCIVYCIIVFLIVFIYFIIDLVIAVIIHVFVIVERRLRKSSSGSINRLIISKPPLVPLRY